MSPTSPAGRAALAMLAKIPDATTHSVAEALVKRHPKLFASKERARTMVRYYRGQQGEANRKRVAVKDHHRAAGECADNFQLPQSAAKKWEPFTIAGRSRVLVLSDLHLPYHDSQAIETAVSEGKRRNADTVVINGDLLDFHQGSTYERDPEKRDQVAEIETGAEFMLWLRSQFPKARIIYKAGNHDERWDRYIWRNAPVLWQVKSLRLDAMLSQAIADKVGKDRTRFEFVTDQRPVMLGGLAVFHGHELPMGASAVNPARGLYLKTGATVLIGHGHRTSQHTQYTWDKREIACWSTGALCDLNPEYARINSWSHGAAFVSVAADGEFNVTNFRIVDGKVRES